MSIEKDFSWAEKYRPNKVADCILPTNIKNIFQGFVKNGDFPHLILSGTAGVGKTTIAFALCNELDFKVMKINSSEENGIDVLRTKVSNFVTSKSMNGKKKVVLFDECERLGADTYQAALRGFIDEYSKNTIFIFTCNDPTKITAPIKSRCSHIVFDINGVSKEEKKMMMKEFYMRCCEILDGRNVEYEKDVLKMHVAVKFPDFRSCIVGIQTYVQGIGKIDAGILSIVENKEVDLDELASILAKRQYNKLCEWAVRHEGVTNIYTQLMKLDRYAKSANDAAEIIISLGTYAEMSTRVADQNLNLTACLMYIMTNCMFNG